MIQEAFTNIEKHSKTKKASLVARRHSPDNILICISDDGVGFSGAEISQEGLGIKFMRQRASIVGAKLDFISEGSNGLMVTIELSTRQTDNK
jgi:signal transduction histidine kinase